MTWLFAAYAIVWIALFAYIFQLDKKQRALSAEIETLRSKLGD